MLIIAWEKPKHNSDTYDYDIFKISIDATILIIIKISEKIIAVEALASSLIIKIIEMMTTTVEIQNSYVWISQWSKLCYLQILSF